MILQLSPAIPLDTPRGPGYAHFVIDYGQELQLLFVCFLQESGECWTFRSPDIRLEKNITMGVRVTEPITGAGAITEPAAEPAAPATQPDILLRLRATQCCDPVIDSLISSATEEISRLRAAVLTQDADNLCWATKPSQIAALPECEFLESCRRYRDQVARDAGERPGRMTIAQMEAHILKLELMLPLKAGG